MGNYVSCTLSPSMRHARSARVIFPSGEIRQFRQLVKAAEIMLESPSCFVTDSRSLKIGRRFSALAADEDLELGGVYIVFPMRRVNSVVTAADVAVMFMAARSAPKRLAGGRVRVSPEETDGGDEAGNLRSGVDGGDGGEGFPVRYRAAMYRSKKPTLETIKEEGIRWR